jgi:hypothetical protein
MKKMKVPKVLRKIIGNFGVTIDENGEADLLEVVNLLASKQEMESTVADWIRLIQEKNNLSRYRFVTAATVAPYGSASDKDCVDEFFSPKTDFRLGTIPKPAVMYAHGHEFLGEGASEELLGEVISVEIDEKLGLRYLIGFYGEGKFADEVFEAFAGSELRFSTRAVQKKVEATGEILVWLVGEVSVFTPQTPVGPCNLKAQADAPEMDGSPDQVWLKWIVELQPAEMREELIAALIQPEVQEAAEKVDGLPPVGTNNAPNADVIDLAGDVEEDEVTKEEVAAMIADALTKQEKCNCQEMKADMEDDEKPVETPSDDTADAKGDAAAIQAKINQMSSGRALEANATKLVDAAGVAPESRVKAINDVRVVLESMGFAKGEGIIDALLAGHSKQANNLTGVQKLQGYQASNGQQDKAGLESFKRIVQDVATSRTATAGKGGQQ